ncbi:hypothetical protein BVY04_00120 [bacterium M21]|nr:hypothetical protein BVY04_00120 [bacterium M21]
MRRTRQQLHRYARAERVAVKQMRGLRRDRKQLQEQVTTLKLLVSAQCPHCHTPAVRGHFCDDLQYICPECGDESSWVLNDETNECELRCHVTG